MGKQQKLIDLLQYKQAIDQDILVKAYKNRNIGGDQFNPARLEVQYVQQGQAGIRGRLRHHVVRFDCAMEETLSPFQILTEQRKKNIAVLSCTKDRKEKGEYERERVREAGRQNEKLKCNQKRGWEADREEPHQISFKPRQFIGRKLRGLNIASNWIFTAFSF